MVLSKKGSKLEYEGREYLVGGQITGVKGSPYERLLGTILEIREGEDKETENETPDIYCSFNSPVLPDVVRQVEERFSKLYQQPKKLEDITLDLVILSPEMIENF